MPATSGVERIKYDAEPDLYRVHHDWRSDDEVSTVVVMAVAEIMDVDVVDIPPLYESINPDALNELYQPTFDGKLRKGGGSTTVTVNDCTVTVYWDGEITIEPPDQQ